MISELDIEEIRMWNDRFPLFIIDNDDPEIPIIHFKNIHIAHRLKFEHSLNGDIRIKEFKGRFALLLNDKPQKSYYGKFFCDHTSIPDEFYFSLLNLKIKIFNDNVDIKSLIRRWKIHNIIK